MQIAGTRLLHHSRLFPLAARHPIAIMRRSGNRGDHRFERWGVGVAQFETELAAPRVKMRGHIRELGINV
jgi:hypothetical protein